MRDEYFPHIQAVLEADPTRVGCAPPSVSYWRSGCARRANATGFGRNGQAHTIRAGGRSTAIGIAST
jgi:hypothetical protein